MTIGRVGALLLNGIGFIILKLLKVDEACDICEFY